MFKKKRKLKRGFIECPYCSDFAEKLYADDDLSLKIEGRYLSIESEKEGRGLSLPINFCIKCGKLLDS